MAIAHTYQDIAQNPLFERTACPVCDSTSLWPAFSIPFGRLKKKSSDYSGLGIGPDTVLGVDRCEGCGLVFANPRIKLEYYERIYNESKQTAYQAVEAPSPGGVGGQAVRKRRLSYLTPLLGLLHLHEPAPDLTILDVGAGFGHTLSLARALGVEGLGVEIDEHRLAWCAQVGLRVCRPEALETDHAGVKFDLIIAQSVIEHVADIHSFGRLIHAAAKPGCVLYVNGLTPDRIRIERRSGRFVKAHFIEHMNYFPLATLDAFMAQHSFQPVRQALLSVNSRTYLVPRWLFTVAKRVTGGGENGSFGRYYRYGAPGNDGARGTSS